MSKYNYDLIQKVDQAKGKENFRWLCFQKIDPRPHIKSKTVLVWSEFNSGKRNRTVRITKERYFYAFTTEPYKQETLTPSYNDLFEIMLALKGTHPVLKMLRSKKINGSIEEILTMPRKNKNYYGNKEDHNG